MSWLESDCGLWMSCQGLADPYAKMETNKSPIATRKEVSAKEPHIIAWYIYIYIYI